MKKAISPLIAGVILVAFTIAVAIIVTSALTTMTKSQTQQATQSSSCPGALLNIVSVSCANNTIKAILTNAGPIKLQDFSVSATINGNLYTNSNPAGDSSIESGKTGIIEAATNYTGEIAKLIISVGNCPGMYLEITNATSNIATC